MKRPEDVQQLDAVQEELKKQDTTLEKELAKEIKKRKARRKKKRVVKKPKVKIKPKVKAKKIEIEIEKPIQEPSKPKRDVIKIGGTKFAVDDVFGIETVRVPRDGVYEINIDALMKNKPIIVLERGNVYFIHLPSAFHTREK
jgi:predicted  nucleic acid-binding Zn-ribbon protein